MLVPPYLSSTRLHIASIASELHASTSLRLQRGNIPPCFHVYTPTAWFQHSTPRLFQCLPSSIFPYLHASIPLRLHAYTLYTSCLHSSTPPYLYASIPYIIPARWPLVAVQTPSNLKLTTVSRACCRLQNSLPHPASTARSTSTTFPDEPSSDLSTSSTRHIHKHKLGDGQELDIGQELDDGQPGKSWIAGRS